VRGLKLQSTVCVWFKIAVYCVCGLKLQSTVCVVSSCSLLCTWFATTKDPNNVFINVNPKLFFSSLNYLIEIF